MNTRNSNATIWVDTHRVTLAEFEDDTAFPIEDMRQGRDCKTPVGRFSMYAGKPVDGPKWNKAALLFWSIYWALFGLSVIAAILAVWPN